MLSLREDGENRAGLPLMTRCYQNVVSLLGTSHFLITQSLIQIHMLSFGDRNQNCKDAKL